jgi:hypothetical protein
MTEVLLFRPKRDAFDTSEIEDRISTLGSAFRDPLDSHVFIVSADKATADYFQELRQTAPERGLPFTLLISVQPQMIWVRQLCDGPELALAREFVEWLLQRYECRVYDDDGHDLTALAKASVDNLYRKE